MLINETVSCDGIHPNSFIILNRGWKLHKLQKCPRRDELVEFYIEWVVGKLE